MKVGIFGGTFDPVHEGHLRLARAARDQFGLEKLVFMPAAIPPHKHRQITPASHRYEMVKIAIEGEKGFEASDAEIKRPEVSYPVRTLEEWKKNHPTHELYLILGADSLKEIPNWRGPNRILAMAKPLVAKRPGVFMAEAAAGAQWILMPECDISSSFIRECLASGKPVENALLPARVKAYIETAGLYRENPE